MRGTSKDQNRVCTIFLPGYVLRIEAMFILNATDGALPTSYTEDPRFDHVSGGLPFRLTTKTFDTLRYFRMFWFALWMGKDPVLTFLAFKRCQEVT